METSKPNSREKIKVGLIMPISGMPDKLKLTEEHWKEVKETLKSILSKIQEYEIESDMVSFSKDANIIQGNIVNNLHDLELVICDISGHNPNVMLELGMRLIFDKPVVIIKDSETSYSFDISPFEHLEYPIDLNYPKMTIFETSFIEKVYNTLKEYRNNSEIYSQYLKFFGNFERKDLEEQRSVIDAMNGNIIKILSVVNKMSEESIIMSKPGKSVFKKRYDKYCQPIAASTPDTEENYELY